MRQVDKKLTTNLHNYQDSNAFVREFYISIKNKITALR